MSLIDGISKMFKFDFLELSRINLLDFLDVIIKKIKCCKIDVIKGLEFDNFEWFECNNLLIFYELFLVKIKEEVIIEC